MGVFLKQLSNFVMASLQGAFDSRHNVWEKMKEMELREAKQLDRAEAMAWKMYNLTKDPKYLDRLEKIYERQSNLLMANSRQLRKTFKEMKNMVKELKDRHFAISAQRKLELAIKGEKLQQQHKEVMHLQARMVAEQVDRMQAYYRENYLKHGREALGLDRDTKDLKRQVENARQELKNAIERTKENQAQRAGKEDVREAKEEKSREKEEGYSR